MAGTLFQMMLQIGILFAMAIGGLTTWYYLALICAAISSVFGLLMVFNVESPVFLFSKGKEDEARKVLKKLRGNILTFLINQGFYWYYLMNILYFSDELKSTSVSYSSDDFFCDRKISTNFVLFTPLQKIIPHCI